MSPNMQPIAIVASIKEVVDAETVVLLRQGVGLKGRILASTGVIPVQNDSVIAELIPATSEYYVVAIL